MLKPSYKGVRQEACENVVFRERAAEARPLLQPQQKAAAPSNDFPSYNLRYVARGQMKRC